MSFGVYSDMLIDHQFNTVVFLFRFLAKLNVRQDEQLYVGKVEDYVERYAVGYE